MRPSDQPLLGHFVGGRIRLSTRRPPAFEGMLLGERRGRAVKWGVMAMHATCFGPQMGRDETCVRHVPWQRIASWVEKKGRKRKLCEMMGRNEVKSCQKGARTGNTNIRQSKQDRVVYVVFGKERGSRAPFPGGTKSRSHRLRCSKKAKGTQGRSKEGATFPCYRRSRKEQSLSSIATNSDDAESEKENKSVLCMRQSLHEKCHGMTETLDKNDRGKKAKTNKKHVARRCLINRAQSSSP